MAQVQAQIHFLVDFHSHDLGTKKLAALTPVIREAFLKRSSDEVHKGKLVEFLALCQSSVFRPVLTLEAGTSQLSLLDINTALVEAVSVYNESGFGFKFDTDFEANPGPPVTIPPYACVQWVWINGELVKKYNYDLMVINGTPPTELGVQAAYRVALTYSY